MPEQKKKPAEPPKDPEREKSLTAELADEDLRVPRKPGTVKPNHSKNPRRNNFAELYGDKTS